MSVAKNDPTAANPSVVRAEEPQPDRRSNSKNTKHKRPKPDVKPLRQGPESQVEKVATIGLYRPDPLTHEDEHYRAEDEHYRAVVFDRDTLENYLTPMLTDPDSGPDGLAQVCIRLKEAVMGRKKDLIRALNTLDDGFELAYLKSPAHQAALKLFALAHLGHVTPKNELLELLNKAIAESLGEAALEELESKPKRAGKKSQRRSTH